MSDLRKKLIRLAHENPSLRPKLLPLLKTGNGVGPSAKGWRPFLQDLARKMPGKKQVMESWIYIYLPDGRKVSVWPIKSKGTGGEWFYTGLEGRVDGEQRTEFKFRGGVYATKLRAWRRNGLNDIKGVSRGVKQATADLISWVESL